MIKISIIVCAFNEEFRIQNCLKSIGSQIVNNFNIEALIVDNESSDNTQKICNKFIKENPDTNIRYLRIDHVPLSFVRKTLVGEVEFFGTFSEYFRQKKQ